MLNIVERNKFMWTNKITPSEIDKFTIEWVNRSFYQQERACKFSDCLEYLSNLQFPAWASIIFFNDPELVFHIPPICFRGQMLPYPLPIFEQDFNNIEKALSKTTTNKNLFSYRADP